MSKPRIIALYLPQYHPFPENDEWWGKGFTEWTNVARAKPLFKGHYQPHIPADLGFYDLRLPIVREQQAELAREAGIEGFCYWHYWFGNGKQLMQDIINDVIASGKPDFPFCLGWANHSWYAKNWNTKDTNGKDRMLIEQTFPGDEDVRRHYEYALEAFKDPRYIKFNNKPFFMIYQAWNIPNDFLVNWNKWAKDDGFDGVFFCGNIPNEDNVDRYLRVGYESVVKNRISEVIRIRYKNKLNFLYDKFKSHVFNLPDHCAQYAEAIRLITTEEDLDERCIPSLIPNFDHSPRSGKFGLILHDSTPQLFYEHCKQVLSYVNKKNNPFVLLRSWNEWGEGNYIEPDLKYGKGYLLALRKALDELPEGK